MARPEMIRHLRAALARLGRDEDGAIVVMAVIAVALFLGIGGLAIDIGRLYNLHTQLQAYADHVSLAAAAELDGESGAIERASRAAFGDGALAAPISYQASFVFGNAELSTAQLTFLSRLGTDPGPGGDVELCTVAADGASDCTAAHANAARFVRASVEPRAMRFFMLPIMRLFDQPVLAQATTAAVATAGFTRQVCNFPPMMMCNPYETATNKSFTPIMGQQILLKTQGNGADWAPGDFGLLDTVAGAGDGVCTGGLGGTNRIRCVMALITPNSSCVSGRVNIRPGQAVAVHSGLNVRFDIWDPPLNNKRDDPGFAPAANVTKGLRHSNNQCAMNQHNPAPDTVPLPRDSCFATGTCQGGRFGNGVSTAQLSDYWATNHGTSLPGELAGGTRYDVYRREINTGQIPLSEQGYPAGEDGAPRCAVGQDNPNRDRRSLIVAVVNCIEHNIRGNTDNVPVIAFARMFMTEPVGGAPEHDMYAEMLGVVEPGGVDGVVHDFPQLYR